MEYKTNNTILVWWHCKWCLQLQENTMFVGFKGDNANLKKDAPNVEESLAIGRMPTSREMRFLFYINIFIHYVVFMLDESYTLSRISISTGNGFHQKVISLICKIPLLYFVSSIRTGTMFDMSNNLCLFFPLLFCILFVTISWTVVFCFFFEFCIAIRN